MTALCIPYHPGAKRFLPGRPQKPRKFITVLCISYGSDSAAPLPLSSKTMKLLTALCVSYDSEATRPPPTHFQRHENDDSPIHFL